MARYITWATEELDSNTVPTIAQSLDVEIPEVTTQGSQAEDQAAPSDGAMFKEERDISGVAPVSLEEGDAPHKEFTINASELHNDDFNQKEKAAERTDKEREEPAYVPPEKTKEPDDEDVESDDEVDAEVEADEEVVDEDDVEPEENSEEAPVDSDDEDADDDSDEEDYGDAETAEVGDDTVEATEGDLKSAEADVDELADTKEELDNDKEELDELKAVASEALSTGGLSNVTITLVEKRVNKLAKKWALDLPSRVGTESRKSQTQKTHDLVQILGIAKEALDERVEDWYEVKEEALSEFTTTINAYGRGVIVDAERKLAKLNTLMPDWESEEVDCDGALLFCGVATPMELIAHIDIEGIVIEEEVIGAVKNGIAEVKSLCDNCKTVIETSGEASGNEWVDLGKEIITCNLGGGEQISSGVDVKGVKQIMNRTVPPTHPMKLPEVTRRDLIEIVDMYATLGSFIEANSGDTAIAALCDASQKRLTEQPQGSFEHQTAAAVITGYYKALIRITSALKESVDSYLKHPKFNN